MDMDQKAPLAAHCIPPWGGPAGAQGPKDVHLLESLRHISCLWSLL